MKHLKTVLESLDKSKHICDDSKAKQQIAKDPIITIKEFKKQHLLGWRGVDFPQGNLESRIQNSGQAQFPKGIRNPANKI
eukprot:14674297-Ditylum_brightwellii.AAC.1